MVCRANAQRGFSMIELVITLALGLVVMLAATQLFVANQVTFNFQRGTGDVQTGGRFAADLLMRDVRVAGLPVIDAAIVPSLVLFEDPSGDIAGLTNAALVSNNATVTSGGLLTPSDQLTLQYGALTNTEDCEGNTVLQGNYVIARYYLRNDPDTGSMALVCDGAQRNPTPAGGASTITGLGTGDAVLVSGVESFQVQLGLDDGDNDVMRVNRYVDIATYKAFGTRPRVIAVRIGLLLRSQERVGEPVDPAGPIRVLDTTIPNTGATLTALRDGRLRRLFVATAGLRNIDTSAL